jgi:hypothetical protein
MCRRGNVKDITSEGEEMLDNYERFLLYREIKCLIADYDKCRLLPTKNELYNQIVFLKKYLNIDMKKEYLDSRSYIFV